MKALALALSLLFFASLAFAHGGNTNPMNCHESPYGYHCHHSTVWHGGGKDAFGCHRDSSQMGVYHCHP